MSVADVMVEVSPQAETGETGYIPEEIPASLAYTDETCGAVAEDMAITGVTSMIVVDRETGWVRGSISAQEPLNGRRRYVERELERSSSFR